MHRSTDIQRSAADQISARIAERFPGHGLTRLIEAIFVACLPASDLAIPHLRGYRWSDRDYPLALLLSGTQHGGLLVPN